MSQVFLTPDELRELTGRARPKAQIAYLRAKRIRHYVNAAGRPVVAKAWLGIIEEGAAANDPGPDFAAIKGAA